MDSGEDLFVKRRIFQAGKCEVMVDVEFHSLAVNRLEVRSANDARGQGNGCAVRRLSARLF
jgi:hypothetical protein